MKIAHGTLVLAADGQKALLLRNEGDERYAVLQAIAHDATAGPPARALGTDRPGRSFASTGRRRSAYEETDRHRQAEDRFAGRAAELLEAASRDCDDDLFIVAPPRFLGALRAYLAPAVRQRVRAEIDKDLVHRETDAIARTVARHHERRPAPGA
jgi:protein required for attachment to host cells